jgi:hypothetical protein
MRMPKMKTVTPLHSRRARMVCARAEAGTTRERGADLSIRMASLIQQLGDRL